MIMACAAAGLLISGSIMLYLVVDAQGVFSVQADCIGKAAVGVLPRARSCHGCQALVVCKSIPPVVAFAVTVVHASLACSGRIAIGGDWQDHQVHYITEEIQSDVLVVGDYKVVSTSQDDLSVTAKVRILSVSLALLVFRLFFRVSVYVFVLWLFFSPL